mmetsp:Transcript_103075/g.298120  ORF Transcript_103075/g.298120 Transcript_103075/m.298120 type:complete len:214 (-) Transcript_103075:125-766(-)
MRLRWWTCLRRRCLRRPPQPWVVTRPTCSPRRLSPRQRRAPPRPPGIATPARRRPRCLARDSGRTRPTSAPGRASRRTFRPPAASRPPRRMCPESWGRSLRRLISALTTMSPAKLARAEDSGRPTSTPSRCRRALGFKRCSGGGRAGWSARGARCERGGTAPSRHTTAPVASVGAPSACGCGLWRQKCRPSSPTAARASRPCGSGSSARWPGR